MSAANAHATLNETELNELTDNIIRELKTVLRRSMPASSTAPAAMTARQKAAPSRYWASLASMPMARATDSTGR